jgi:hypothetical protein
MNLEETVALLTWINQHDPRVQLNAAARDIWGYALSAVTYDDCRQAVLEHYKVNDAMPVNSGTIHKRAKAIETSRAAGQRARMIEAAPDRTVITNPRALRSRNPELWDKLFAEGRQRGNEERARNGAQYGVKANTPEAREGNLTQFNMPEYTDWANEDAA